MKRLGVISSNTTASLYSYWLYILWHVIIISCISIFFVIIIIFFCVFKGPGFWWGEREEGGRGVVGRLWLCSPDPPIKLCSIPIISHIGSNFLGTLSTLCKRRPTFLLLFPLKTMRSLQKPLSLPSLTINNYCSLR